MTLETEKERGNNGSGRIFQKSLPGLPSLQGAGEKKTKNIRTGKRKKGDQGQGLPFEKKGHQSHQSKEDQARSQGNLLARGKNTEGSPQKSHQQKGEGEEK